MAGFNAAQRVSAYLQRAHKVNGKIGMAQGMLELFDIQTPDGPLNTQRAATSRGRVQTPRSSGKTSVEATSAGNRRFDRRSCVLSRR
jgi:hypothetical protein